jgi:TPR repeat protein
MYLGMHYDEGIGLEPDPAEAARFYRRGCEMGLADSCARAKAAAAK